MNSSHGDGTLSYLAGRLVVRPCLDGVCAGKERQAIWRAASSCDLSWTVYVYGTAAPVAQIVKHVSPVIHAFKII